MGLVDLSESLGIPAHVGVQQAGPGLPDASEPTVDLFAAETGAAAAVSVASPAWSPAAGRCGSRIMRKGKPAPTRPATQIPAPFFQGDALDGK